MRIDVRKDWHIRFEDLEDGPECAAEVRAKTEDWMKTDIPCDIRETLISHGLIKEPLEGMNCFESEWIENKSWWFKKSFTINEEVLLGETVELVLESMDYGADIFLNGQYLGCQLSTFYPFIMDVKALLKPGQNDLLIRLTTGLERINPEDMKGYVMTSEEERRPGRGDKRKGFLRKPQYSFGWDWNPRISTCGIVKGAWLESHDKASLRWVRTYVKTLQPQTILGFVIEIENFHPFSTLDADICIALTLNGDVAISHEVNVLLRSGINSFDVELPMQDAKLWWPNGMGEQPLYDVTVSAVVNDHTLEYPSFSYGIRTVEVDMSKSGKSERQFAFIINGVRTFCKGANWIPADSLYGRVKDERYETLIMEAREANFNMLRIWGGGLYERDIFYEYCDRYGIILWHDFMFACSEYPDDRNGFMAEVEKELEYQTRRLCNHPSMVLWCGNNEIHWAYDEWWKDAGFFGSKIFNHAAPKAVRRNCPDIPYWNSSPYGGMHPNSSEAGDRHHWFDCMMNEDMEKRITPEEYDRVTARFVSEYGYVGPLKRSSIEKYLEGTPFDIRSDVWQHHNNTFEKDTVLNGISYHYADPEALDIDSYLLYAGLCQGLMYAYSLEAFRYKKECSGGLFWMYNDCWGETGWTILDYYLTRKISYYFVKRALAPVKFILREEKGLIQVMGANDGPRAKQVGVEYGYISFDGSIREIKNTSVRLEPHSRDFVLGFEKGTYDDKRGVYFVRAEDEEIPLALLRTATYRELKMPAAKVRVDRLDRQDCQARITINCSSFAHAVHLNLPDEVKLSDEYFDLLPGESRSITVYNVPAGLDINEIHPTAVNG